MKPKEKKIPTTIRITEEENNLAEEYSKNVNMKKNEFIYNLFLFGLGYYSMENSKEKGNEKINKK